MQCHVVYCYCDGLYTYPPLHSGDALKTLDQAQVSKWSSYLALKAAFYESYVGSVLCRLASSLGSPLWKQPA